MFCEAIGNDETYSRRRLFARSGTIVCVCEPQSVVTALR